MLYSPMKQPGDRVKGQEGSKSEFSTFLEEMTTSHPSTAFKQPPQQNRTTHKKAEQPPKKDSGNISGHSGRKVGKDDRFSAAMSALNSLDISSSSQPQQGAATREGGADKMAAIPRQEPGQPKARDGSQASKKTRGGGGKKERELSPSVVAIFEAAGKRSGEGKSGSDVSMATGSANTRVAESSTSLKNLLNIGSPPVPSPSNYPAPQGDPPPEVPEAVRKLMRPSLAPPLGPAPGPGLLPNPYNTHPFMRG